MPALPAHPLVRSIAPLWAFPLRWIGSLRFCNCGLSVALVPQAYSSHSSCYSSPEAAALLVLRADEPLLLGRRRHALHRTSCWAVNV